MDREERKKIIWCLGRVLKMGCLGVFVGRVELFFSIFRRYLGVWFSKEYCFFRVFVF